MPAKKASLRHSKDDAEKVKEHVEAVYKNARFVITEFVEDCAVSTFLDVPMNVWYNLLSSLSAMVLRIGDIKDSERLQEAVVYQVGYLIVCNDLPVDDDARKTVVKVYEAVAPTAIDILIPGEGGHCGCLPCC